MYVYREDSDLTVMISASGQYESDGRLHTIADLILESFPAICQVALNYNLFNHTFSHPELRPHVETALAPSLPLSAPQAIAIHGGAGEFIITDVFVSSQVEMSMLAILNVGTAALQRGDKAVDVVQLVTRLLEDCELYNAGRGSVSGPEWERRFYVGTLTTNASPQVFNENGTHELEASIVDGATSACGAVACTTGTRNPIRSARIVLERGKHCLISGPSADALSQAYGDVHVENTHFSTKARHAVWKRSRPHEMHPQTVGTVVCDKYGNLAAASSTGGVLNKKVGRIGDIGVPGSGVYAGTRVAVACSGDGDVFLKLATASRVAARVDLGQRLARSIDEELANVARSNAAQGGIIAIDHCGNTTIGSTCRSFFALARGGSTSSMAAAIQINPQISFPQMEFCKQNGFTAAVSVMPSVPMQVVISWEDGKNLCDLSQERFRALLLFARRIADVLKRCANVVRVAMVADGTTSLLLTPLHGLDAASPWQPVCAPELSFTEDDPGFVDSKGGPMMDHIRLQRWQTQILKVSSCSEPYDNRFNGQDSDHSLFAQIVRGKQQQWRIWEDSEHVAFLTPFCNRPGFVVLVPRYHAPSDIFSIGAEPFAKLALASQKVAKILCEVFETDAAAVMFEGYEIDYAHVKIVPRGARRNDRGVQETAFMPKYTGFITSQPGPRVQDMQTLLPTVRMLEASCQQSLRAEHGSTVSPASREGRALETSAKQLAVRLLLLYLGLEITTEELGDALEQQRVPHGCFRLREDGIEVVMVVQQRGEKEGLRKIIVAFMEQLRLQFLERHRVEALVRREPVVEVPSCVTILPTSTKGSPWNVSSSALLSWLVVG